MSQLKATPGPWKAHNTSTHRNEMIVGADGVGPHHMLAKVYQPYGDKTGTNVANAHLIAAAPELFEALSVIRNQWAGHAEECAFVTSGYRAKCDCDWPKLAKQADTALAKARGEAL